MTINREELIRQLVKEIQDIEYERNKIRDRMRETDNQIREVNDRIHYVAENAKAELGYNASEFASVREVLFALWKPVSAIEPDQDDPVISTVPAETLVDEAPPIPPRSLREQRVINALVSLGRPATCKEIHQLLPDIKIQAVGVILKNLKYAGLVIHEGDHKSRADRGNPSLWSR